MCAALRRRDAQVTTVSATEVEVESDGKKTRVAVNGIDWPVDNVLLQGNLVSARTFAVHGRRLYVHSVIVMSAPRLLHVHNGVQNTASTAQYCTTGGGVYTKSQASTSIT
jgi:hypothetical protein